MTPEAFLKLTPRFIYGIMRVIARQDQVDFYHSYLSYALSVTPNPASLDKFLGIGSEEGGEFSDVEDKIYEAQALKSLEERKKQHGR